ncbi:MAG: hypothetical protein JJ879_06410 [Sneathiella sp.]|nr:hypothetical protein [Sneathiella sp.]
MKIILLIAVVGIVFFVARQFRKPESNRSENAQNRKKGDETATEMVKCPDCGTFVSDLSEHNCHN